eukprot:638315-Rhodomonas_salina.2
MPSRCSTSSSPGLASCRFSAIMPMRRSSFSSTSVGTTYRPASCVPTTSSSARLTNRLSVLSALFVQLDCSEITPGRPRLRSHCQPCTAGRRTGSGCRSQGSARAWSESAATRPRQTPALPPASAHSCYQTRSLDTASKRIAHLNALDARQECHGLVGCVGQSRVASRQTVHRRHNKFDLHV